MHESWLTHKKMAIIFTAITVLCIIHLYLAFFVGLDLARALYSEEGDPELEVVFYFATGIMAALCWLRRNESVAKQPADNT